MQGFFNQLTEFFENNTFSKNNPTNYFKNSILEKNAEQKYNKSLSVVYQDLIEVEPE